MTRTDFFKTVPGIAIAKSLDFESFKSGIIVRSTEYKNFLVDFAVTPPGGTFIEGSPAFSWLTKNDILIGAIHASAQYVAPAGGRTFKDCTVSFQSSVTVNYGLPEGIEQPPIAGVTYPTTGYSLFFPKENPYLDLMKSSFYVPNNTNLAINISAFDSVAFAAGSSIFMELRIWYANKF